MRVNTWAMAQNMERAMIIARRERWRQPRLNLRRAVVNFTFRSAYLTFGIKKLATVPSTLTPTRIQGITTDLAIIWRTASYLARLPRSMRFTPTMASQLAAMIPLKEKICKKALA